MGPDMDGPTKHTVPLVAVLSESCRNQKKFSSCWYYATKKGTYGTKIVGRMVTGSGYK